MGRRWVGVLGLALLAAGCADKTRELAAPPQGSVTDAVDAVARAIALGMAQPAARLAVRDAMRASPLTEHKLSLQEYAASENGELLLRAAAAAAGTTVAELRARIAALPDLDFYLPGTNRRLTWRGGADYIVAASISEQGPRVAYGADGKSRAIDLMKQLPTEAVFFVQAAERKGMRIGRQPDVPGLTIQDPGDGTLSGTVTVIDRTGIALTVGLAEWAQIGQQIARQQCLEDCEPVPPPPPPPPPPPSPNRVALSGSPYGVAVSGNIAYITQVTANRVARFDLTTNTFTASIPTGTSPAGVVFNPAGTKAYVAHLGAQTIGIIDVATATQTGTIPVQGNPLPLAISLDGNTLFVTTNVNKLFKIDLTNNTVTGSLDLPATSHHLLMHPNGNMLYVATRDGGSVLEVAWQTMTVARTFTTGGRTQGMAIYQSELYVANETTNRLHVINLSSGAITNVTLAAAAHHLALNASKTKIFIGLVFDGRVQILDRASRATLVNANIGGTPRQFGAVADGRMLLANEAGSLDIFGADGSLPPPPPPPPPPPQTYLEYIATNGVYDNNNPLPETNEFEFRAITSDGTTEVLRVEGIEPYDYRHLHVHLIYAIPPMWVGGECNTTTSCEIAARETDASPNPDDYWYFHYQEGYPPQSKCKGIPLGSGVDDGTAHASDDKLRTFALSEGGCTIPIPAPVGTRFPLGVTFDWP